MRVNITGLREYAKACDRVGNAAILSTDTLLALLDEAEACHSAGEDGFEAVRRRRDRIMSAGGPVADQGKASDGYTPDPSLAQAIANADEYRERASPDAVAEKCRAPLGLSGHLRVYCGLDKDHDGDHKQFKLLPMEDIHHEALAAGDVVADKPVVDLGRRNAAALNLQRAMSLFRSPDVVGGGTELDSLEYRMVAEYVLAGADAYDAERKASGSATVDLRPLLIALERIASFAWNGGAPAPTQMRLVAQKALKAWDSQQAERFNADCPDCKGRGRTLDDPPLTCRTCGGSGVVGLPASPKAERE